MKRYDSYKDSGIQWLGKIPSHWLLRKSKYLWDEKTESSVNGEETLLSVSQYDGITEATGESRSESLAGYKIVHKDDLVINIMLAWMGGLGVSSKEGIVSPAYCVYRLHDKQNPKYLHYLYKTPLYLAEFARRSSGVIPSRWRMYTDDFGQVLTMLPPPAEQDAIVKYLDSETAKIDEAIAQQQRMIDLLNERKQIIITHAVTRGLNNDSQSNRETIPLRHIFEFRNGYTPSKADSSLWTNGTIPWFRMEDIRNSGRFLKEAIQNVTPQALGAKGPFSAGSYILAICTASIGEHAMLIADSLANQRFANLKIRKSLEHRLSPMFIFYYLYVVGDFCRNNANSTCFQYVDMDGLKKYPMSIPSLAEQNEIVEYLDKNLESLSNSIAKTERLIELLRERKQIIINEVVTGKVKIS